MGHTDKPLVRKNDFYLYFPDDPFVAFNANSCLTVEARDVEAHKENTRQLAAAWNLCRGVSTEIVEQTKNLKALLDDFTKMAQQLGAAEQELHELKRRQPTPQMKMLFSALRPGQRFILLDQVLTELERTFFVFRKLAVPASIYGTTHTAFREADGKLWTVHDNCSVASLL